MDPSSPGGGAEHRVSPGDRGENRHAPRSCRAGAQEGASATKAGFIGRAWDELLSRPMGEVLASIVDPGERARELRQSSPFAGVLTAAERWRIWREVGERARGAA